MNITHHTSHGRQRGGTLVGFILGLLLGLLIAVGVALYVTKAPIPFVNKVGRAPTTPTAPLTGSEPGKLPDPNKSLYPKEATAPAESTEAPAKAAADAPAENADSKGGAPVIDQSTPPVGESGEIRQSFLQAGAFKSPDEAENMKARLALLGFEAKVSQTDRTGTILYRVRIGPYGRADDLNRVRQRLSENGIQPSVVLVSK